MIRRWRALLAWWRTRHVKRDRLDDLRVLLAIQTLRPERADEDTICRISGIHRRPATNRDRAYEALLRLVRSGQVEIIRGVAVDGYTGQRLFRITGSRLVEVER